VGERVLVASCFLDKEQEGDRALFCLDAKTGEIRWRTPLKYNPWGGPSVIGDMVVVSASTIGYDPRVLKQAKGQVAAFDLVSGKEKWRKELNAGVVSCAALTKDLAVISCTDGKVRAYQLASGQLQWSYDAQAPLFAPPAVAADRAFVGDLKGVRSEERRVGKEGRPWLVP